VEVRAGISTATAPSIVRPVSTSQNTRCVFTPVPSWEGHVSFAGSVLRTGVALGFGAGLRFADCADTSPAKAASRASVITQVTHRIRSV